MRFEHFRPFFEFLDMSYCSESYYRRSVIDGNSNRRYEIFSGFEVIEKKSSCGQTLTDLHKIWEI